VSYIVVRMTPLPSPVLWRILSWQHRKRAVTGRCEHDVESSRVGSRPWIASKELAVWVAALPATGM
jgi:hypothetical protein